MKLKNKKTEEIIEFDAILPVKDVAGDSVAHLEYNSLAELNAEWEDYEEPIQVHIEGIQRVFMNGCGRVFIDYATAKEAELAVRKLKAWKRLKDFGCGFMLDDYFTVKLVGPDARKITSAKEQKSLSDSYKLLFGGEE